MFFPPSIEPHIRALKLTVSFDMVSGGHPIIETGNFYYGALWDILTERPVYYGQNKNERRCTEFNQESDDVAARDCNSDAAFHILFR